MFEASNPLRSSSSRRRRRCPLTGAPPILAASPPRPRSLPPLAPGATHSDPQPDDISGAVQCEKGQTAAFWPGRPAVPAANARQPQHPPHRPHQFKLIGPSIAIPFRDASSCERPLSDVCNVFGFESRRRAGGGTREAGLLQCGLSLRKPSAIPFGCRAHRAHTRQRNALQSATERSTAQDDRCARRQGHMGTGHPCLLSRCQFVDTCCLRAHSWEVPWVFRPMNSWTFRSESGTRRLWTWTCRR